MGWIAVADKEMGSFHPGGLHRSPGQPDLIETHPDALMVRGTLMLETRIPDTTRPRTLLHHEHAGDWPFHLSVKAVPGGGMIFVLNQGGAVQHQVISAPESGRTETLRLTFCWDAPARRGHLALEFGDDAQAVLTELCAPSPLRVTDLQDLFRPGGKRFMAPEIEFIALSTRIEPVGPSPGLNPDTPIATPHGYRPLRSLRRGDLVISERGTAVPVLQRVIRTVPAYGSFRPLSLRSPYFGLQQDLLVAPGQRLLLRGSDVEYLFGHQAVLSPARHFADTHAVHSGRCGALATYAQLLLPGHDMVSAAGATLESLFIGRLHRKPALLSASLLSTTERARLPDHGTSRIPVLRPFDARILAERRAA